MSLNPGTSQTYTPEYLSYSAVSKYEECPRSWYLSYVRKAEERQTWYLPMGTAVHESIESYLKTGDVPEFTSIFYPLIEKQLHIDPNHREWLSAGSGEHVVQGQACIDLGRRCVDNAIAFLKDMDVWHVEYEMLQALPGLEVPVKLFIDIIGEHKKHGPRIVDWKSGKNKPKDIFQLEVYKAACVEADVFARHELNGYWGMLHPEASPKTEKGRLVDLSHVDPLAIGERMQRALDGMKRKVYRANVKFGCSFCWQQDNCLAHQFPRRPDRAVYYDNSSKDGVPF